MKALFVDPSNRRCVDCHALSPHYVVCGFGVFVCTRCSGVHSSFGHRIKGITVAEFTEEEVDRLARAGNGAFGRLYLGSLPKGYMKPHEMGLDEVRQWIEDVYVKKLYYKKPVDQAQAAVGAVAAGPADRPAARPAYLDIPEEEIALVPLADILGANTPILRVESKGAAEAGQVAGEIVRKQEEEAARAAKPSVSIDILDGWDPFGDEERTTAREGQEGGSPVREDGRSPPELPGPSFQDEWATFVDDVKEENHGEQEVPFVPDRESLFLEQEVKDVKGPLPLEAFLDPAEAQMKQLQRRSKGPKVDASVPSRTVPPPVPLETFFPEFEEIRRTGVLPTGVPDPTRLAPRLAPVSAAPARASPARVEEPPAAAPYSLGGYDLRAAYAPKASESGGNPFA